MKENKQQGGFILLVLLITICIITFLFLYEYSKKTEIAVEQKDEVEQSVDQIKERIEQNFSDVEKMTGNTQNELKEDSGL